MSNQRHRGFTLIELVVVIAILAILAAVALPRFAQLSAEAHRANIRATAGALSAGVALTKTQWVTNGFTTAQTNVVGFGNDNVDVNDEGWPTSVSSDNTSSAMDTTRCAEVWQGVLQSNAPTVTDAGAEYVITAPGGDCVFTYQGDGQGSSIAYDPDTGDIVTDIN
ncbi:MAG TPA: prepilin-type N-terminal cleavage/methylation domain-containing protein [Marinobacter sp.]|nr:prepilin-type N-terminal cleavage/methylation domain-containing protein [Marinobacter sp.]